MEVELSTGVLADLHPAMAASRGVVLITDIQGRRPLFDRLAATLSQNHRWNVIVVDPFARLEADGVSIEDRDDAVGQLQDDDIVTDLVEAANRLEAEPVAVMGFSLGGMYAYKAAASVRFDRVVSFYGMPRLPARWRGPGQWEPLSLLGHVEDCSNILALVGTDDIFVSRADVEDLVASGVQVQRYRGARHNFVHDPSAAEHRPRDAADAWKQAVAHVTGNRVT